VSPGKYQAYPKYVESNIAWLGKVPVHWSPLRFKHALFEKPKTSNPKLDAGSISFGEVVYKHTETLSAETKNSYQEVLPGEFLVNPLNLNFDLKSLRTALSSIAVVVSTGYIVLKSSDRLVKRYVRWLLQEFDVAHMKTLGSGVRQTINYTDIGNSFFYEPPPEEQTQIAKFLDYETAKIDALIAKQQQLIALLQEKRQAVISHAVTKGLNPAAPLRDSGVAWLGQVPAHWEVAHVRHVLTSLDSERIPISAEERGARQGPFPYYGASGIIDHVDSFLFDEPLVLVCEDGWNLLLRTQRVARSVSGKAWVNNHAHVLRPNFGSSVTWSEMLELTPFALYVTGMRQPKLTADMLKTIPLAYPPTEDEHDAIGQHITDIRQRYAEILNSCQQLIDALQERRTALISAAVTGKIDVRGWQPPPAAAAGGFDEPHGAKATVLSNDAG
jgi:type I restriction enzyme S subunit